MKSLSGPNPQREEIPFERLQLDPEELDIQRALIKVSESLINELCEAGMPPSEAELFPNKQVFVIAGGYARDKVSSGLRPIKFWTFEAGPKSSLIWPISKFGA